MRHLKKHLISLTFGATLVMGFVATSAFAEKELHFESSELILVILILQLVAIGGAYLFAFLPMQQ